MKIKVLHIVDSLRSGGAETVAVNTVNALSQVDNVDVFLCATRLEGPQKEIIKDINKYLFLDRKKIIDISAFEKLNKFIETHKIQMIHAHSTSFFLAVMLKLRKRSLKVVWHNHSGKNITSSGKKMLFVKVCSRFFNGVINVNNDLNNWAKDKLYAKNNYILNNFAHRTKEKKVTKLKSDKTTKIVCVAGLRKEKDHINLLKAFKIVGKEENNVSLHIIGKNYNNQYSKSLIDFVRNNSLDQSVFFYDNCDDVFHILNQADIGVLSSNSEGLPISLLEYGLAELPVVVTDVGDCSNVVTNRVNGIVVSKEDSEHLATGISQILKNKSISVEYGKLLKEKVETEYSEKAYVINLIKIYNSLN